MLVRLFRRTPAVDARVEVLTRAGCPLCREAERAARDVFGRDAVRTTDITLDRALEDEFVFRIPVLRWNGEVIAEGRITRAEALRARDRIRQLRRGAARR